MNGNMYIHRAAYIQIFEILHIQIWEIVIDMPYMYMNENMYAHRASYIQIWEILIDMPYMCMNENLYTSYTQIFGDSTYTDLGDSNRYTGWRRLIGSPKLQIISHTRATKYMSLLRKITYKDKGSYESWPPCTVCVPEWKYAHTS